VLGDLKGASGFHIPSAEARLLFLILLIILHLHRFPRAADTWSVSGRWSDCLVVFYLNVRSARCVRNFNGSAQNNRGRRGTQGSEHESFDTLFEMYDVEVDENRVVQHR
jgi:hypothetical protein